MSGQTLSQRIASILSDDPPRIDGLVRPCRLVAESTMTRWQVIAEELEAALAERTQDRELLDALNNGELVHVEANVAWDTNNAPVMEATFMAELTRWPTLWPTETIAILRVPIGLPAQESHEDENNER